MTYLIGLDLREETSAVETSAASVQTNRSGTGADTQVPNATSSPGLSTAWNLKGRNDYSKHIRCLRCLEPMYGLHSLPARHTKEAACGISSISTVFGPAV
jgi:ribosomal protein L37E